LSYVGSKRAANLRNRSARPCGFEETASQQPHERATRRLSSQVFTATLTCSPNASTQEYHDADRACSDIAEAGGDFTALPGRPGLDCSTYRGWMIRTTATGTWNGQPVNYDVLHENICEVRKATDQVFVW
jgi:hypothetical protein